MIKVWEYAEPTWGFAFKRISKAFRDYSPDFIEWVDTPRHADVSLLNIVDEVPKWMLKLPNRVIIQHVHLTGSKNIDWLEEWKNALLTISFHPLDKYYGTDFKFLHMPWGADTKTFFRKDFPKDFKVITTGHVALTENIDKLYLACKKLNTFMIHTGQNFGYEKEHYKYLTYMRDSDLADVLNSTQYVSCLRENEGFEMLGIEGLFCGARPIVFDLPSYQWYKGYGIFIQQDNHIVDNLVEILSKEPTPLSEDEYKEVVQKFSWDKLVKNMFNKIAEEYNGKGN